MREGYKKTEVGVIPEDWEVVLLSDICEVNPKKDILENDDEVAFLPMEQVSNSGRIIKINTRKYGEVSKGYTPFKNKDVLLAKITPCFENGKRALIENLQYKMGFGSTEFHVLRSLEGCVIPKYLYYCIDTYRFKELAERNMTGSAGQKRVPTTFLKDFRLPIPPLKEQEKIAEILSTVDSQIDDTEKFIEKSKELKKGLMQKLLTKGIGHSEFKKTEVGEIPVSWEVKKLGELIDIKSGSSPSKFNLSEKGEYPFFKVDDMNYGFKYLNNSKLYFNSNDINLMKSGMVLFPKRGASIFTNKILILNKDGYFDTNIMGLICKEYINNEFLYYSLYYYELSKIADTSSIPQINNKHIEPLNIELPPLEEQEKIVQILSSIDNEIEEYESKKQKLEKLKKGLMQQLLIGKIRVFNNK